MDILNYRTPVLIPLHERNDKNATTNNNQLGIILFIYELYQVFNNRYVLILINMIRINITLTDIGVIDKISGEATTPIRYHVVLDVRFATDMLVEDNSHAHIVVVE